MHAILKANRYLTASLPDSISHSFSGRQPSIGNVDLAQSIVRESTIKMAEKNVTSEQHEVVDQNPTALDDVRKQRSVHNLKLANLLEIETCRSRSQDHQGK